MENNPKKSKAFIIAFILILLLLIGGYYLFKNSSSIFGTKGSTTISKVFAPLLGTSKNKDLTVIVDPNAKIPTTPNLTPAAPSITGIVITDNLGNKIVRAEAGEDLKKGDVLYISGFNANKDPIVMKAISSDKSKSLVFGVAAEDMLKGKMGNVIIEGILTGVPTNRKEVTAWAANNPLYLSDKIYGGMTKNPPSAPSFVVPVGSVIKVDAKNGSIRIGGIIIPSKTNYGASTGSGTNGTKINTSGTNTNTEFNPNINKNVLSNLKSFNSQLLNDSGTDLRGYFSSIYGAGAFTNLNLSNTNGFNLNPITLPAGGGTNGAFNGTNFTGTNANLNPGAENGNGSTAPSGDNTGANLPAGPALASADLNTDPSACKVIDANPLTYTDEEQRELDDLLRKFYLIASTLKTESDLSLAYREIEEYKALINETKYITKQCYDQIDGEMVNGVRPGVSVYRNVGGETIRFGNPWFKYTSRGSYLPNDIVLESSCKYCEPNTQNGMYCGNLPQTKDQNVPFCEPNGKDVRAIGNFSRYINQFGIPAFGTPKHVVNKGNPMTGWTKMTLTYINPVAGIISWLWPAKYVNPGPTIQYTNLQDFEKVLNVW